MHGVGAAYSGASGHSAAKQNDGVVDSRGHVAPDDGFGDQFAAAAGEGEQVAGKISAVNRGDILGIERLEVGGDVPVE